MLLNQNYVQKRDYTFNDLVKDTTFGTAGQFKAYIEKNMQIAYNKAIESGLCTGDKNAGLSPECFAFVVNCYVNILTPNHVDFIVKSYTDKTAPTRSYTDKAASNQFESAKKTPKEFTLNSLKEFMSTGTLIDGMIELSYAKAMMQGLCTSDRDAILSNECVRFIFDEHAKELDFFAKKILKR